MNVCRVFVGRMPYVCLMSLKPNGISYTVYPERPAKDYNEWMQHITNGTVQNVVDDYHEKFNKLWQAFKLDVQRNTKKP